MKLSTYSYRRNRKRLVKLLTKYKDNEEKYEKYYKQLQEVYYKYKIKKYQWADVVNKLLSNFVHKHKLRSLEDIKHINDKKKKLMGIIKENKEDINDMVEKFKVLFSVLEGHKIEIEGLQNELKFVKNIKNGIAKKSRSNVKVEKLVKI